MLGIDGAPEDAKMAVNGLFRLDNDDEERLQLRERRVEAYEKLVALCQRG